VNDPLPTRAVRLIRIGIAKPAGLLIILLAIAGALAIVGNPTAARVLGLIALTVATVAGLAVVGRSAKLGSSIMAPPPSKPENAQGTATKPDLDRPREVLIGVAQRLALSPPAAPETSRPHAAFEPLVTVVMPVHNDEPYVVEAIESVRRQSYGNWECVVIDDASSDASFALVESSAADDARFRVIRHDLNRGPGAARNRGIDEARGRYLAFLDADDLLLRESLADRVGALVGSTDDLFVTGSFCAVRFSPEDVTLDDLPERRHAPQPDFVDFVTAGGECPFTMIAPLVETETIRAIGGFDERMRSGGVDWDLWYRILRNGYVFVPSRTLGSVYRQRGGGITRGNPAAHTEAAARLIGAAHRDAETSVLVHPTPYPMTEPLSYYQERITVAERAVRFAAMALVDGDRKGMASTISILAPGTWPLLDRHLDFVDLVARGAARALGVKSESLAPLVAELAPFVAEVAAAVRIASK
jgi:glycosyltransferase involved in cell wall biosynthesis